MKRSIKIILGVIAALLIFATGGLLWKTRQEAYNLLHSPMATRKLPEETPVDYNLPYEDITVTNPDGMKLAGWFIPSENGAVIIMQHGYKSTRKELLNEAEMMHRHGYGALITSIRAHDYSEGELITLGVYETADMEAWYQYLLTRDDIDPDKIGILGNSYGGMLSIQYAAQNENIKAVVANSAFSSMPDTVATSVTHFTNLPEFPFVPLIVFWAETDTGVKMEEIDATKWIPLISPRPVFLMQGGADTVISPQSGQRLYDAAKEPKELWFDPELGHVEFDKERAEEYEARVSAFFDQYLLGK
ncbi:MAG TPA: alpha/beta hydrolase [Anaerolineales bacterium]|nr:alpha/beta hydrolase [Anaerolineales bacterium]HNN12114.1 alpha/beta hydrolase [Anaerolineales bacterium]HNO31175.1 alpha/beta hydrolase [Anaerolineales bacterium]